MELHLKQMLLWAPVCLGVGIWAYFSFKFEPGYGVLFLGCLGVALSVFSAWRFKRERFLFLCIALVLLGFLVAAFRAHSVAQNVLGWRYYGAVEGTVAFVDRSRSERPRLTLIDPSMPPISAARTPQKIRVSLFGAGEVPEIGSRIRVEASFSPPSGPPEPQGYDFRKRAWFQGLGAVGYTRKNVEIISLPTSTSWALRLAQIRHALSAYIRSQLSLREAGFAAAILVGDRAFVDQASLANLRAANMAHLLAISGLHMGLLTGVVFALLRIGLILVPHYGLRWPTKKIAAIFAILAGGVYLVLSGSAVATERAFIMATMMFGAILFDRPAITLRAVAMAAFIILFFWPENLSEPGFQMSFAATLALVVAFRWIRDYQWRGGGPWGRFLRSCFALLLSSAVAGAATAPFAAYHFNQIAHFGIVANSLSLPVMGMIIMPCAIIAAVLYPLGLDWVAFWGMEQGISWILYVANWVAGFENAISLVPQGSDYALPLFVLSALGFVLMKSRLRFLCLIGIVLAFAMWASLDRPAVLITENGRMVGVLQGERRALNRDRGNGFASESWLENDGQVFDQEKLAGLFTRDRDEFALGPKGQQVFYLWDKHVHVEKLNQLCEDHVALIAPKTKLFPNGDCAFWNERSFRRTGSIAIWFEEKLKIKTARQQIGARLWSDYWVRQKFQ